MTIKTKLYIIGAISIGLVLSIGLFVFFVNQELKQEMRECEITEEISQGIFDLNILTNDYLLHQEKRARIQWQSRYDSLATFFRPDIVATFDEDEKHLIDDLRKDYETIGVVFAKLVAGREQQSLNSEEENTVLKELEERLIGQLSIHSQTVISKAAKLDEDAHKELVEGQRQAKIFIFIFLMILVLLIIAVVFWVIYNVVKPLGLLQKGAEAIGKGNLTYRIDIEREDEIGQLATSFNKMTAELEKIYPILKERMKELSAIYEISKIMEESTDLEKALNRVVKIISSAYRFPELACARIIYNNKEYKTENFRETNWKQFVNIEIGGEKLGIVEVFYFEKKAFFVEEEKMLKELASQIGSITERKKAEEQLAKHSEQLEKEVKRRTKELEEAKNRSEVLLASIGDGVFAIDKERNIIHFNKKAEELSGYKAAEVLGKPYYDVLKFVKEKDRSENIAFIRKALKGEIADMADETFLIKKDGSELPVADSAAPVKDEKGELIGVIVAFRDASKERKIQQMRSEFISFVSHELKAPLVAISGYLEMLTDKTAGVLTKEQGNIIDNTTKASNRLVKLVNDLLEIGRFEEGRIKTEPILLNPAELAEKAVTKELQELFEKKKQQFILKKPASLPKIKVDPKFIITPIQNLLSNASKYTPTNGKIELEVSQDDKGILFRIADSGIGIPQEEQLNVFSKFFRASNATDIEKGTGLGLYLSKVMIELSRGKIWFKSKEGKGTTFYITLPVTG